ncbi:MAG: DNA translocase FtsK 4TM domain-containing protein [Kiritimatiellae bacterium]|nr:DNA translocase FtsK 4TM domain-containing protein [Kiritimatiellia bacterium]
MTNNSSSNTPDASPRRSVFAWLLFPLALFPLAALLTYDWRAIPALNSPPAASSNWIGALGDGFAYYGYLVFGLAIWIAPLICVAAALCLMHGRRARLIGRTFWSVVLLCATACLLQVVGNHANGVSDAARRINLSDAGGAVGYLTMTRLLSPLLSDFGSAVLAVIVLAVALIAAAGTREIAQAFAAVFRWAAPRRQHSGPEDDAAAAEEAARLDAAMRAREEAARQRKAEKEAAKAEKIRAKEERRMAKIAAAQQAGARTTPAPVQPDASSEGGNGAEDDRGPYVLPPLSLLNPLKKSSADHGDVDEMSSRLIDTLKIFGVDASLAYTVQGPVVTKYALHLAPGIRYSAVTNISDNLMGALHAKSLRIEAPIPGEDCVGIEVPNRAPAGISFREIVESDAWRNFKGELPLLFGKDAAGNELVADLASMPHMLVAGATGQGKSVCLNAIINGLLMTKTPEQLKLIMVDPKSVEFAAYEKLPHLIVPVITDNRKVVFSLHWAVAEMEKRLKLFKRANVKNIHDFNHRLQFTQTDMFGNDTEIGSDMPKTVPYIVIIIDEVADLMAAAGKEVTPDISRLTAKARAAGIHLILATQRPDAKIITGTIKANIPGRVAFKTSQAIDSRTILDDAGAENLIGRGDMLFKGKDGILIRAQGAWISDPEISSIVRFIEQHAATQFDDRFTKKLSSIKEEEVDIFAEPEVEDKAAAAQQRAQVKADAEADDFKKAVACIINTQRASTSHFQRQMGWGYNHAAKILDMLTERGIVSPPSGMGARQIVMDQDQLAAILSGSDGTDGETPAEEPLQETSNQPQETDA